ncbi:unnamed protein product [Gordionus sp. m RMFG-2023]
MRQNTFIQVQLFIKPSRNIKDSINYIYEDIAFDEKNYVDNLNGNRKTPLLKYWQTLSSNNGKSTITKSFVSSETNNNSLTLTNIISSRFYSNEQIISDLDYSEEFIKKFDFLQKPYMKDYCLSKNDFHILIIANSLLPSLTAQLIETFNHLHIVYTVIYGENLSKYDTSSENHIKTNIVKLATFLKQFVVMQKICFDVIVIEDVELYLNIIQELNNSNLNITQNVQKIVEYLNLYFTLLNTQFIVFPVFKDAKVFKSQAIFCHHFRPNQIAKFYLNPRSTVLHLIKNSNMEHNTKTKNLIYSEIFDEKLHLQGLLLANEMSSWDYETVLYSNLSSQAFNKNNKSRLKFKQLINKIGKKSISIVIYKTSIRTNSTTNLSNNSVLDRQTIYFGSDLKLWPLQIIFYDCLLVLLKNVCNNNVKRNKMERLLDKNRYLAIDIDDIFVGKVNPTVKDIEAIMRFQKRIQTMIPNFNLNLGFSGELYNKTNRTYQKGYEFLLNNSKIFNWFSHEYQHQPFHLTNNITNFNINMEKNKLFSKIHKLKMADEYAVAPKHSGVYPIQPLLYETWKKIFNISVTSTTMYPHMYPRGIRRGFIHNNISVLPRQDLALFAHQSQIKQIPNFQKYFNNHIHGGHILKNLLYNKVNIFMTHIPNYCFDHLAVKVFEEALDFILSKTNIIFKSAAPIKLAQIYFKFYPKHETPIWTNPCHDTEIRNLWYRSIDCYRFPKILIIGPQKTGTTALLWFLNMNPNFASNKMTEYFEETQFFSSQNYLKGIDWYLDLYEPILRNVTSNISMNSEIVYMDKSATYFDSALAPMRVKNLVPESLLFIVLLDPIDRAYSWYQHMRYHMDETAIKYDFKTIISMEKNRSQNLTDEQDALISKLKHRCLDPGKYVKYINSWLQYFSPKQIIFIDGDNLKKNAPLEMMRLQNILPSIIVNYDQVLKYDPDKRFYCQIAKNNRTICMPKSKGRRYVELDDEMREKLKIYYNPYNKELKRLMASIDFKNKITPDWLKAT